jgi:hypothetical protein
MATVMSKKDILELAEGVGDLRIAMAEGYDVSKQLTSAIKEEAEAQAGMSAAMSIGIQGVKTFSTVMSAWNSSFAALADLAAGNINELVDLYNAQIKMIRAQNVYTQGIALQSVATQVYGKGSEEATRATVAANYVGALYKQSKVNEMVAANAYVTASFSNAAKIMTAFTEIATTVDTFVVALSALRVAQLGAIATTEAETTAQVGLAGAEGAGGLVSVAEKVLPAVAFAGIYQSGGFVPKTGLALVHAGETVVPKGATGGGVVGASNVEIHIHATSNVDLARVRQEVENALAKTLLASQKQRGVY